MESGEEKLQTERNSMEVMTDQAMTEVSPSCSAYDRPLRCQISSYMRSFIQHCGIACAAKLVSLLP